MNLIGLFGVLLAISPVFAAETGRCAGNVPTRTVEKCDNQRCTYEYAEDDSGTLKSQEYRPCERKTAGLKCREFTTMDDCLSHQCIYTKTTRKNTPSRKPRYYCTDIFWEGPNFKVIPSTPVKPL